MADLAVEGQERSQDPNLLFALDCFVRAAELEPSNWVYPYMQAKIKRKLQFAPEAYLSLFAQADKLNLRYAIARNVVVKTKQNHCTSCILHD